MNKTCYLILTLAILVSTTALPLYGAVAEKESTKVVRATLNGLEFVFDADTGGILRMTYPGPGTMLDATPETASIVGVVCSVKKKTSLLFGSRYSKAQYSKGAKITKTDKQVVIHWDKLGASSPSAQVPGSDGVSATVTFTAAADGRSVIADCKISNRSGRVAKQVIFPEFTGLVPTGEKAETEFRTGGSVIKPFVQLRPYDPSKRGSYKKATKKFTSGGVSKKSMIARWMDLGSLKGGFSLFPKRWGFERRATVLLQLWKADQKLRLMVSHSVNVKSGGQWQSGQYVITPHISGWAKGIEPYRQWVKQNMKRVCPLPDHIRNGMGFRTLWMCRNYAKDPEDVVWRFSDLPKVAQECKDRGLTEMVMWFNSPSFELPLSPMYARLGGDKELIKAVAKCKEIGVNVAPFISVCITVHDPKKYTKILRKSNYTYHPEFIPRFTPPYASGLSGTLLSTRDPLWQKEVLASCKQRINKGLTSICWDQFFILPPEPNLLTVTRKLREYAYQRDPQATFSGEEMNNLEVSSDYLDYTWNWRMDEDFQPLTSVFPSPRINHNIDDSPEEVKRCFVRNRFMNIQPRKPDGINGSDWIANHPPLNRALKQCAKLRTQFLPYFVEGTLIGDCILSEPCSQATVAAYVLPDKVLVIVLNNPDAERQIDLQCNLPPWLESLSGHYKVKSYDGSGKLIETSEISRTDSALQTTILKPLDITLFELMPR